jgi:hypothetical protein
MGISRDPAERLKGAGRRLAVGVWLSASPQPDPFDCCAVAGLSCGRYEPGEKPASTPSRARWLIICRDDFENKLRPRGELSRFRRLSFCRRAPRPAAPARLQQSAPGGLHATRARARQAARPRPVMTCVPPSLTTRHRDGALGATRSWAGEAAVSGRPPVGGGSRGANLECFEETRASGRIGRGLVVRAMHAEGQVLGVYSVSCHLHE